MKRLQRLRSTKNLRDLVSESGFTQGQLIQPLFVVEDLKRDEEIPGLKGVLRHTVDSVRKQVAQDVEKGVRQFILFFVPAQKRDEKDNWNLEKAFSSQVLSDIKKDVKQDATLWVDTCLCSFTNHGHCCLFDEHKKQDLERTLSVLSQLAVSYVQAGADGISPSDMNDGRVAALRQAIDRHQSGRFNEIPIMSYSTKFASVLYGPFRSAADSAPQFGDRASYQIDVRNRTDAIASSVRCAEEGADLLMLKPGMTSIDLLSEIKTKTLKPVGVYQVSGEYASLVLLQEKGLLDFEKGLLETWNVFKRAGAQFIVTYGARLGSKLGLPR